jgi:hypothetical protein
VLKNGPDATGWLPPWREDALPVPPVEVVAFVAAWPAVPVLAVVLVLPVWELPTDGFEGG